MGKLLHGALQVLGVAVQVANQSLTLVPAKYQPLVTLVVGAAQAGLALYNHGGASGQSGK